jgi:glycine cleavage system aminomethyltransferase T
MQEWNPVALSAIQPRHLSLGATLVETNKWLLPARYSTVEEETELLRTSAGVSDISSKGKLAVQGEIDSQILQALGQSGPGEIGTVGKITHESGEIVIARLAADDALLLTAGRSSTLAGLVEHGDTCSHTVDMTSVLAGLAIVGPTAQSVLTGLTEIDTSDVAFPDLSCAQGMVAEVRATLLRVDHGGVPGYELYFGRDYGEYMWDSVLEAGEPAGLTPVGAEALAKI